MTSKQNTAMAISYAGAVITEAGNDPKVVGTRERTPVRFRKLCLGYSKRTRLRPEDKEISERLRKQFLARSSATQQDSDHLRGAIGNTVKDNTSTHIGARQADEVGNR